MISERWQERLDEPGSLPALPEVLVRLRSGLHDLNIDMDVLCDELRRDAALAAEIIKTINSPLFGMRRTITTIRQAVVLLGLRRVRSIILSQSLRQSLATYQSPGFELFAWWDRSLLKAVAAAMLCQRAAPDLAEEAYLGGLMADIGVLVLARFEPGYDQLLRHSAPAGDRALFAAEQQAGIPDHPAVTGAILARWQLPGPVVIAARRHHDPSVMDSPQPAFLPRAVHFASLVADCVATADPDLCAELATVATSRLFMSPEELADFVSACLDRYGPIATDMGQGALIGRGVPAAIAKTA